MDCSFQVFDHGPIRIWVCKMNLQSLGQHVVSDYVVSDYHLSETRAKKAGNWPELFFLPAYCYFCDTTDFVCFFVTPPPLCQKRWITLKPKLVPDVAKMKPFKRQHVGDFLGALFASLSVVSVLTEDRSHGSDVC